jgi:hypothetical protein
VSDKVARRELRACRVAVQAERSIEMGDIFSCHLIHQQIDEVVWADLPGSHLAVTREIFSAEPWRQQYCPVPVGEWLPALDRYLRVFDELII